jgi:pectate lyase
MSPNAANTTNFCNVNNNGNANNNNANNTTGGIAPDSVRCYTVGRLRPQHPTQKENISFRVKPEKSSLDASGWTLFAW